MPSSAPVTKIIAKLAAGDRSAAQRLLPQVYDELRALAAGFFRQQKPSHTLQPTALVHEAFIKLVGAGDRSWTSRKHFFDVAAMAMRQLLADHARQAATQKRGGGARRVTLSEAATPVDTAPDVDLVALDASLAKLSRLDPRQGRIVELRYLAGFTVAETADVLGVSERTVKLDWQMARSFLRRELSAQ